MGFIKILRWRVGGALNQFTSQPQPADIGSLQRAAVFLIGLGREHASLVFDEFTREESEVISREVNRFQDVDPELTRDVFAEFLEDFEVEHLPSYVDREDFLDVARALARNNPFSIVDRVRRLWFDYDLEPGFVELSDDQIVELSFEDLEPAQKAAVFMMWLPPELSAMVLQRFPPNLVHTVTGILVELPFVVPKAREEVLAEFMDGVSMGIPGLSVGDVGLPVVVEAYVRSDPDGVAKRLESKWLSSSTVVIPRPLMEDAPVAELTPLEKCAVFFQSLSLPLAYRLLSEMDPETEVGPLLETMEKMEGVDSDTRKLVLQELMLATKPELREKPQPIHILGKAMGNMIRRKPTVVVTQIRKHWLAS